MRTLRLLVLGLLVLGCEAQQGDPNVLYRGRTIRTWMDWAKGEDETLRDQAWEVLRQIGPEDYELTTALTETLKDENPTVRTLSLRALGNIGPKAKAAMPEVNKLISTGKGVMLREALQAMKKIEALPQTGRVPGTQPQESK